MIENRVIGSMFDKICTENKLNIKKRLICTAFESVVKAVVNGIAIALIPDTIAKQNLHKEIKYYSISEKIPNRNLYVFHKSDAYLSSLSKKFISYLINKNDN